MMKMRFLLLSALLTSASAAPLVADEVGEGYEMVLSSVSEIGEQWESRHRIGDGSLLHCNRALKTQVLPRVVPRGSIMSPGGNSYEWTVYAAVCKPEARR